MSWALYEVTVEYRIPVIARSQLEAESWAEEPSNAREAFDPYGGLEISSYKQAEIHRGMSASIRNELDYAYIAGDEELSDILDDDTPETDSERALREAKENNYGPFLPGLGVE